MSTTVISLVQPAKPSRAAARSRSGSRPAVVWDTISCWLTRRRQRNALANLAEDKHLLADIGLTREQALREAGKPFWR
jgi:uncharacterized protein YjiS (DUF1127 family)